MYTGAMRTSIGNKDEFKSLTEGDMGVKLKGIAAGLDIKGKGIVEYNVRLPSGEFVTLRMHAFWVPALGPSIRLISPQGIRLLWDSKVHTLLTPTRISMANMTQMLTLSSC